MDSRTVIFVHNLDVKDPLIGESGVNEIYKAQSKFAIYMSSWSMDVEFICEKRTNGLMTHEVISSIHIQGEPEDKTLVMAMDIADRTTSSEIAHNLFIKYMTGCEWFKKHVKYPSEICSRQVIFIRHLADTYKRNAIEFAAHIQFEVQESRAWFIDVKLIYEMYSHRNRTDVTIHNGTCYTTTTNVITRKMVTHQKIEGKHCDLMLAKAINSGSDNNNTSSTIAHTLFWRYVIVPLVNEMDDSKNWLKINAPESYNQYESHVIYAREHECKLIHES